MTALRRPAALGGALALALMVVLPGPARADHAVAITFTAPGEGQRLGFSSFTVSADVATSQGTLVGEVVLEVKQLGTDRPPLVRRTAANNRAQQQVAFSVTLPYNGSYEAKITARANDPGFIGGLGAHDATGWRTRGFSLAAAPETPQDVKAVVDPETRAVTVTWKANAEPDTLFYLVQRARGDGAFEVVGKADGRTSTTYRDSSTTSAGGDYRYQVVAVRSGVRTDEGISSDPSAVTAESTAKVPDPPAPPSATTSTPPGPGTTVVATASGGAPAGGTSSGGAPSSNPGALTTSGSVDLSGFKALQSQAQPRSATRGTQPPDTGFRGTLPFSPRPGGDQEEGEAPAGGELGELASDRPGLRELGDADDAGQRQQSLAFLAAGLLATVLLMHVLWIKGEVKRVPLEPLTPE